MCKHDLAISMGVSWQWCPKCGAAKKRGKKEWIKPSNLMRGKTDEPIQKDRPKDH